MPFTATWMDLEDIIPSEVSQTEKDKYYDVTCMWNLKNDTNELIYKSEIDSQTQKTWLPKGQDGGVNKLGGWD